MKQLPYKVFPSDELTIQVADDKDYGGAHTYFIQDCKGFNNGKTEYCSDITESHIIQFVQKADDGTITAGMQSEQLAYVLLDRAKKLNVRFPSSQNEKMIAGLQMFLDACQERVQDRINRGVMGDLKK